MSLADLVRQAVEKNPEIKAARLEWARVIQRYPQAVSYDDPMLTFTYGVEEIETRLGPQDHVLSLSQRLPFPGKLSLKGDVVAKEVEIARTRYERTVRDVIVDVKKSFYELYYIDRAIKLTEQNKKVLEHFTKISTTDYALDATALNDVVKAQSQYAQASYDLILLKEMRAAEATRLNTLLDRDPEYRIEGLEEPQIGEFDHTLEELYEWAVKNEELRIAGLEVEKNDLEVSLSKYKYLPDFSLGVNYSSIGDPARAGLDDAGRDALSVTFGINIPIWFSKNRAAVSEAELKKERALRERAAVRNEILNRVKNTFFKLTNSERLIELYGKSLIPQAQQSMEIAETWYKEGQGSFTGLLETQSIWLNFQLAYFRAVADYLKNLAELERITGRAIQ